MQCGILARDGGHFHVAFWDEGSASKFAGEAEDFLGEELPGLRFTIEQEFVAPAMVKGRAAQQSQERALAELPQFQFCQAAGNGTADVWEGSKRVFVSRGIEKRRKGYARFREGISEDIIGLVDKTLKEIFGSLELPQDVAEMCGDDYLAVIHVDGNDIGKRAREQSVAPPETPDLDDPMSCYFARESRVETFFWRTRVAMRRSVVVALTRSFGDISGFNGVRPFQLLMLGGDDLLLVCRAKRAIDFLVTFAEALRALDGNLDGRRRFSHCTAVHPVLPTPSRCRDAG